MTDTSPETLSVSSSVNSPSALISPLTVSISSFSAFTFLSVASPLTVSSSILLLTVILLISISAEVESVEINFSLSAAETGILRVRVFFGTFLKP